jgi:hypothetical protein
MKEPQEWQEYEKRVEKIANNFVRDKNKEGAKILKSGYGHKNKIKGMSGVKQQVDAHVEYISADGTHCLLLCECKYWSGKVDLSAVLKFFAIVEDIRNRYKEQEVVVNANLIATKGYKSDAKRFADHYGIATNTALKNEEGYRSFTSYEGVTIKAGGPGRLTMENRPASAKSEDED